MPEILDLPEHLYLPELRIDKKINSPSISGYWKNDAKTIIRGISDSIVIGDNIQGVSSVPDIWARPLMFQNFLLAVFKKLDPKIKEKDRKLLNSLELRTFQEWKGLLSILALSQTKLKYDKIELLPYKLPELKDGKKEPRFQNALRTLVPSPIKLERGKEYRWTDTLILRYRGVPVGAFSPTTLVFSAGDYNEEFKQQFAQKAGKSSDVLDDDGYLCPPKNNSDLLAIGEWLTKLIRTLAGDDKIKPLLNLSDEEHETDKLIATTIKVLLEIWLKQIKSQLGKEDEDLDSERVKISDVILGFNDDVIPDYLKNYKIYEALLKPLIPEEGNDLDKSDVLLDYKRNKFKFEERAINQVVLISDQLYSEDLRLWGIQYSSLGTKISDIIDKYFTNSNGVGQEIKGKPLATANFVKDGIIWVHPEQFFLTDTLLTSKSEVDFLSDTELELNVDAKYVLPFKREILDFFSPTEVRTLLNPIYDDRGDKVIFSFNLPIVGREDSLQIKKIFKKKNSSESEGIIYEIETPILDIFPHYLGENWRTYYLFQHNSGMFNAIPLLLGDNSEVSIKEYHANYSGQKQKVSITNITGEDCFPEGLEILNGNEKSGLILIGRTERIKKLEDKWTIGIDFGTSNTNVYKKINEDGSPEQCDFDFPNLTRSISKSKSDLRSRFFNDFFIPNKKIELPITTTIKMYSRDEDDNKNILTDYFIYFPEDKLYEFPELVLSNIKWDGEIINTKYFLKNLLFLLLVDVVEKNAATVKFAYSWPKAFSPETRIIFKETWELVYNELVLSNKRVLNAKSPESSGNIISLQPPTLNESEGVAAGEFFASKLNLMHSSRLRIASVCLDVGGGTTDISVWWNNNIIEDFSVLFAGKQISSLLQKSGMLRKLLFSPEACIAFDAKKDNPTKFSAVLNHVFQVEDKEICSRLVNLANDEKVKRFRQMIAIEYGALAYYAGMVCISVGTRNVKDGKSILTEISSGGISLYWGGNAAKLIKWIDFGKSKEDGLASFILNALFYNCLTDKSLGEQSIPIKANLLQQVQSPRHKSEASGGLVAIEWDKKANQNTENNNFSIDDEMSVDTSDDTGNNNSNELKSNFVVCGENIEVKGRKIPFYSMVNDQTFFDGNNTLFSSDSNQTAEQLNKFIKIMNTIGVRKGFFTEDSKIFLSEQEQQAIINNISSEFLNNQTFRSEKRIIEPIFIMEVRYLMDILWNKWNK